MSAKNTMKNSDSIKLDFDFSGKEYLGDRPGQEDYSIFRTLANGTELIAVLADGMGGHTSGEVASKLAVDTFDATFSNHTSNLIPVKLGAALQQCNSELANCIRSNPALDGMGCTLVGIYISKAGIEWISVGDSPLFLFRSGKLTRLNADHSMAPVIAESLKSGKINKEEAKNHPNRNALRSALMGGELNLVDASSSPNSLYAGDIVLLASDGLLTLSDSQIQKLLSSCKNISAQAIADLLINEVKAKNKPRQDNTTVQVVVIPKILATPKSFLTRFGLPLSFFFATVLLAATAYFFYENPELRQKLGDVISLVRGSDQIKPTSIPSQEPVPSNAGQGLEGIKQAPDASQQPEVKKEERKKDAPKTKPFNSSPKQKDGSSKPVNSTDKEAIEQPNPDAKPGSKPDSSQDKNVEA